jgi:hypothetical protein
VKKKEKNEFEQIIFNLENRRERYDKWDVRMIEKEIHREVKGDEELFLLLRAKQLAMMNKFDPNMRLSLVVYVISVAAFVAAVLSFVVGASSNTIWGLSELCDVVGVVLILVIGFYALYELKEIVRYRRRQEELIIISLCIDKYEKKYFRNGK